MLMDPTMPAASTVGFVHEAQTPYGHHWSCTGLPSHAKEVFDPDGLLSPGDVVTVHDARDGRSLYLLRVGRRDGNYVRLKWMGRR